MAKAEKSSILDKEKALREKIEKAKKELTQLQQRKKMEIGQLACQHKLDQLSMKSLDHAFAKLAKELLAESA